MVQATDTMLQEALALRVGPIQWAKAAIGIPMSGRFLDSSFGLLEMTRGTQ